MDSRVVSFTAANAMPWKLFRDPDVMKRIGRHSIPPAHIQLIPTNRCNLSCSYCSCVNRNVSDELSFSEMAQIMERYKRMGTKAVTITGGGEPMLHERINDIICHASELGITPGLVSNGLKASHLSDRTLKALRWIRFSCSDELEWEMVEPSINWAVNHGPDVDFAFSYVLTRAFNPENLAKYIRAANHRDFTHVRIVSDLTDLSEVLDMTVVKESLRAAGIDDSLVIYQGRKDYEPGAKRCWISLLKPVISADGYLFPCCGAQYAEEDQPLDLGLSMRMGEAADIERIWMEQRPFDGSRCIRCYYGAYNKALDAMLANVRHGEFI